MRLVLLKETILHRHMLSSPVAHPLASVLHGASFTSPLALMHGSFVLPKDRNVSSPPRNIP